jgi:gliding motility-associated-like protein
MEAEVELGFSTVNGQAVRGNPLTSQGFPFAEDGPEKLFIHWFNGVSWINLGGERISDARRIRINSSQLGRFEIRTGSPASQLSLEKTNVYPSLFTPNEDGRNDHVYFVIDNPNKVLVQGSIYDLLGRLVSTLPTPTSINGTQTTLVWDGKDFNQSPVPSGIYVYQIVGESKKLSGTVAVAR